MPEQASPRAFEEQVLPHLNAAYSLARWLTANTQDAEDVVQEACLRAYRFFGGFRGGDARAWLLKIVRNASYTWLQRNRGRAPTTAFDEEIHTQEGRILDPSTLALQKADRQLIQRALKELPPKFREVLVLREVEGLSYQEIAEVAGIPMGTVMSSLARARRRLRESVVDLLSETSKHEAGSLKRNMKTAVAYSVVSLLLALSFAQTASAARLKLRPSAPEQPGKLLELAVEVPVPQALGLVTAHRGVSSRTGAVKSC